MNCQAYLIRPKDEKILKREIISKDTYPLCEEEIKKRNKKTYKDERYWVIREINV